MLQIFAAMASVPLLAAVNLFVFETLVLRNGPKYLSI